MMVGGDGDRSRLANAGGDSEGVLTWYEGERGTRDTSGIVGVPSGEGDLE